MKSALISFEKKKCQKHFHQQENRNSQDVRLNESIFVVVKRFIQMESMIFIYFEGSEEKKEILKIDDDGEKISQRCLREAGKNLATR